MWYTYSGRRFNGRRSSHTHHTINTNASIHEWPKYTWQWQWAQYLPAMAMRIHMANTVIMATMLTNNNAIMANNTYHGTVGNNNNVFIVIYIPIRSYVGNNNNNNNVSSYRHLAYHNTNNTMSLAGHHVIWLYLLVLARLQEQWSSSSYHVTPIPYRHVGFASS